MEHAALIYTMVLMSAADSDMTDRELFTIGEIIRTLPAFEEFDPEMLPRTAEDCASLLAEKDGLDTVIGFIDTNLPETLRETAYALACEIAAVDGHIEQEELRLLEMIRHRLKIDRLHAAAIERGVAARYKRA
jgi:tellurite resistance protein